MSENRMGRLKYKFFWDGCLSNWHPSKFAWLGVEYNCAEQYMMYWEAKSMGDHETAELIMKTDSPRDQKRLGRIVKNFDPVQF